MLQQEACLSVSLKRFLPDLPRKVSLSRSPLSVDGIHFPPPSILDPKTPQLSHDCILNAPCARFLHQSIDQWTSDAFHIFDDYPTFKCPRQCHMLLTSQGPEDLPLVSAQLLRGRTLHCSGVLASV